MMSDAISRGKLEKPCPYHADAVVICNASYTYNRDCAKCGWHPDVESRRKAEARIRYNSKKGVP